MTKMIKTKFVTNLVKFVNVNLYKPYLAADNAQPKYCLTLIIPKSEKSEISRLKKAFEETALANKDFLSSKPLKKHSIGLKDGDKREDPVFADSYYLTATSIEKPGIVDVDINPIIDADELYDGCLGRASITLYPYVTNVSSGIAVGLNNVQKLKDGKKVNLQSGISDFDAMP